MTQVAVKRKKLQRYKNKPANFEPICSASVHLGKPKFIDTELTSCAHPFTKTFLFYTQVLYPHTTKRLTQYCKKHRIKYLLLNISENDVGFPHENSSCTVLMRKCVYLVFVWVVFAICDINGEGGIC